MESKLPEGMNYCRRCQNILPSTNFYDCADAGFVDKNLKMSVCKSCINSMYDEILAQTQSMEKTLHKLCTSLNIIFSNEAVAATKAHIKTLLEGGKNVNAIFGVYKQKIVATQKSMSKSGIADMSYEDVGTIYTEKQIDTHEVPIPEDVITFWGKDLTRSDIEFLETQYANFRQTHKADSYAEITLLKQVCYTLLDIKQARAQGDVTEKLVKELQELMKNLAISPKEANTTQASRGEESFGLWIQDIEKFEPAEWLKTDPRGDMYRDVANIADYFDKYFVRPTKNFIMGSRDFNVEDDQSGVDDFEFDDETNLNFGLEDNST